MSRIAGSVSADVLVNTTSVGMHPAECESPVAATALPQFQVVFDAIYTPLQTQLLKVSPYVRQHLAVGST